MITHENTIARLLCFSTPNLPELQLALTLPEVLEIAPLMALTPVPFAPPFVMGLALWRSEAVTVIDLAAALSNIEPLSGPFSVDQQYLIALALIGESLHRIAWPILPGSATSEIPALTQSTSLPATVMNSDLFHAVIRVDGQTTGLVNIEGIFIQATRQQWRKGL
jgi:chemotaxis signal transduction protein